MTHHIGNDPAIVAARYNLGYAAGTNGDYTVFAFAAIGTTNLVCTNALPNPIWCAFQTEAFTNGTTLCSAWSEPYWLDTNTWTIVGQNYPKPGTGFSAHRPRKP